MQLGLGVLVEKAGYPKPYDGRHLAFSLVDAEVVFWNWFSKSG